MEVHHHSHTARQKWTHYSWEFLMLFLAVFCGFLAEYRPLASKGFKTTVFHEMIATDTAVAKPTGNPVLFTTDPVRVNELVGGIQYFKRVHQIQLIGSGKLLTKPKRLSNFIKKNITLNELYNEEIIVTCIYL